MVYARINGGKRQVAATIDQLQIGCVFLFQDGIFQFSPLYSLLPLVK